MSIVTEYIVLKDCTVIRKDLAEGHLRGIGWSDEEIASAFKPISREQAFSRQEDDGIPLHVISGAFQ